jgi:hypothetical protein
MPRPYDLLKIRTLFDGGPFKEEVTRIDSEAIHHQFTIGNYAPYRHFGTSGWGWGVRIDAHPITGDGESFFDLSKLKLRDKISSEDLDTTTNLLVKLPLSMFGFHSHE